MSFNMKRNSEVSENISIIADFMFGSYSCWWKITPQNKNEKNSIRRNISRRYITIIDLIEDIKLEAMESKEFI